MADNFDKFLPDWQIGTLTLSANSTAFTATDALLTFGSIQQGDFIISPDGRMLVIESITDDDSGVLSTPCPPEAAGTFQTRIRYQSDNSRYTGQTAALRRLLSGGNLFALSKLAGDPETIVRFLANGSFDLVDPATFGLQDPNGTLAKFAALKLAARQILQTDENGALKTLTLAANKFLRTDANGDIGQSDLGVAAIALLNLSGAAAADRLPYLNSATGAALTPLTAQGRNLLGVATAAGQRATVGAGKPAFKAHLVANQLVYNGTTNLSFTAAPLNVGNCWNGSIFTAPEAGVYFFSMGSTLIDGNNGLFLSQIFVNGSVNTELVWGWNTSGVQFYRAGVCSVVVSLAVGATVQFKLALEGVTGSPQMQSFRNHAIGFMI